MAVRLKFVKVLKDFFSTKKAISKRALLKKQKEESAHFDSVNQDIVNVTEAKRKTKGIKKFLEFLEVALDWFNRSLYWLQRDTGKSAIAQPNPVNYNCYPTSVRKGKTLSKVKLNSINKQKAKQFQTEKRKTFKENLYNKENSTERAGTIRQRQTFLELMQVRQSSNEGREM